MSINGIKNFLSDELDTVNNRIKELIDLSRDNKLRIDEANYFIKELTNGSSSGLSSSYISEKKKSENLINEKNTLEKCLSLQKEYDEELDSLNLKKEIIEESIESLNQFVEDKKSLSREKSKSTKSIKDSLLAVKKEIIEANEFIQNSVNEYSYIDPNRVVTDSKIYQEMMDKVLNKIDSI